MEGIDMLATEMDRITQEYHRLRAIVPLGRIRSKREYERAVGLLDAILDEIGEDEKHPMADLADAIGVFVERYEADHSPIPPGKPADVLRFLMTDNGLRQSDFPEIDSQGVASEILSNKRELNTRQIRKLAKRFCVSVAVFV